MNCLHILTVLSLALILSGQTVFYVAAQELDYHSFTDKTGKTIEASPLSISPDKAKLSIQLKDKRKFEIQIVTLSLDDQQFIKNWLKSNPAQPGYEVELKVEKHLNDKKRLRHSSGNSWITEKIVYDLTFKNLSEETLKDASMEYYVVVEQGIYVHSDPDTGDPVWSVNNPYSNRMRQGRIKNPNGPKGMRPKPKRSVLLAHGKMKLEELRANYSATIKTKELQLREINLDGGGLYGSDKIYGVIARLTDASGQEIGTYRSNDIPIKDISWEQVTQMPQGDPSGASQPRNN